MPDFMMGKKAKPIVEIQAPQERMGPAVCAEIMVTVLV